MARSSTTFKPGVSGNPNGAPGQHTKQVTADGYKLATKLASLDKSDSTIAHALGVSVPTFLAMKRRDPKLAEALDYGKGLARDSYIAALQEHGKTNLVAHIFLLKGLHGVQEGTPPESQRSNVTIVLPGAPSLVDYRPPKLIEHDE